MLRISGRQINFEKVEIVLFSAFCDTHSQRIHILKKDFKELREFYIKASENGIKFLPIWCITLRLHNVLYFAKCQMA